MTTVVPGYPIRLKDSPTIWRGTEFEWTLQMGADGATVDLTGYGDTWEAHASRELRSSGGVDFTIDTSHLADGYIVLSLTGDQTILMLGDTYGFDVIATGGPQTPFPVWTGEVVVDGSWTIR